MQQNPVSLDDSGSRERRWRPFGVGRSFVAIE